MKKNKNEKNDSYQNIENSNYETKTSHTEDIHLNENFSHFPVDEELYLNAEEAELKMMVEGNHAFSDDEEKQNENKPESENGGYPAIPFLVELNPEVPLFDVSVSGKEIQRSGLLSEEEDDINSASEADNIQDVPEHQDDNN